MAKAKAGNGELAKNGTTHTTEPNELIEVFGARVHNLRNIDISIPKNKLVVITGISGSGKSSLAFDTIYAEGQRRYMESSPGTLRLDAERIRDHQPEEKSG